VNATLDDLRKKLCALGDHIRDRILDERLGKTTDSLATVAHQSAADTIYAIDKISEAAIAEWFESEWPATEPVQLIMEGLDEDCCFPRGTPPARTQWKCLLDPIDGTRCLMYDKRSAWVLAGLAPQNGDATVLSQIETAAMTELPTTKQWRADQISAVRGHGLRAESCNILEGTRSPLSLRPSLATDFRHGFSWMAKYFPEGRTLTAQIEERLWDELVGLGRDPSPTVFDDQYLSTGGAFYELLTGHDRMIGDLRPLVYARLDLEFSLACHPYDVAAALLLDEAGIIYEHPLGGFPDAPLDTTSGIAWIAYANPFLAAAARPVLQKILNQFLA
jgi:fructose-1,6-bisphosphatase/inositol monophosphatase family enzyme